MEIRRRPGQSKPTVWRWQARFAEAGVDGLVRDKTRPPGRAPLPPEVIRKVVSMTTTEHPPEATHWSARLMAKVVGIAPSSVQKIWRDHGLRPLLAATSNCPKIRPSRPADRCRRALPGTAGSRPGAVGRREKP